MSQVEYSEWFSETGWRIDERLRRQGVMPRFRAMLGQWGDETLRQFEEHKAWEKRRNKHFAEIVSKDLGLQDEKARPPGVPDDWQFTCARTCEALPDETDRLGLIWGWCPLELTEDKKPDIDDPLSFGYRSGCYDPHADPDRVLSLPEKYVVCALIHDACCMSRERVTPWTRASLENDKLKWLLRMRYEALIRDVVKLPDRARPAVEACMKDVEADLEQAGLVSASRGGSETEQIQVIQVVNTAIGVHIDTDGASVPAASQSTATGVDAENGDTTLRTKGMSLEEATGRLERLCDRGDPYTSQPKLAEQIGCSSSTVNEAFKASPKLRAWMSSKTTPRAVGMNEVVSKSAPQSREEDPADAAETADLSDDKVDAVMARLIDQAQGDNRAELNRLDPEQRRKLVRTFLDQEADREPSPLSEDPPGRKPKEVRQYPRL